MNSSTHSLNKLHTSKVEQFQSRFTARLCIVSITILQIIIRLVVVFGDSGMPAIAKIPYLVSIPACFVVWVVIALEYIAFKKIGPRMIKYSQRLDLVILFVFTADWLAVLLGPMKTYKLGPPATMSVSASMSLVAFGYRCLFQTFLVQSWQLRALSPVITTLFVTGFNVAYSPGKVPITVFRGIAQAVLVIVLFYFEDKVKWRMIWANLQQEKWMQVNDFILNNIPENIMILDIEGETKFISEYCKSFLAKCHLPLDAKVFFKQIRDLNQQVDSSPHHQEAKNHLNTARNQSNSPLINHRHHIELQNIDVLEDLLTNFKAMIKDKRLQEKQFLIYHGKLKTDDSVQDKSIEIKISFIEQLEKAYIILIIRDTTQRDLLIALEDNNKYKDQLLASVSHELRAPLNGNINLVETAIQSKEIPKDLKESLLVPALRSSKFLLYLINDILDMSQIKAQKLRLVFQSNKLRETLNNTVELVELQARKKGIQLSVQLEPNLPINFNTDHLRLSQIVLNLLNNAIKFTPQGTVKLIAQGMEMLPWVKISVQDSGIGMTQENMAKLFTSFTHIEFKGREGVNPHGVGLGLTIAHNLAGMLGPPGKNKIQVESSPNKGSIFSFLIENKSDNMRRISKNREDLDVSDHLMYVPDEHVLQPKMVMRLQTGFSTNTMLQSTDKQDSPLIPVNQTCVCPDILIVDDNPFNTMAFETILDSLGVKCEVVYDGKSALERIQGRQNNICQCGRRKCKQYKIIFMDQEMPGMTGSETVREIKNLQRQKLVNPMRIIGCTAHGSKEEVDKFLASGIDQCIHKPISAVLVKKLLDDSE